jgi:putative acetyltransferase
MRGAGQGLVFRDAHSADAPCLARIYRLARQVMLPGLPAPWSDAALEDWLRAGLLARHRVTVAVADGRILGYLGRDHDPRWDGLRVLHLYLHPDAMGRGLGAALLDRAKAESGGQLSLLAFERARRTRNFYRRHGLREQPGGIDPDNKEAVLLLRWEAEATKEEERS